MRVLHATLRFGGGTAAAIMEYAEALPEFTHILAAASAGWGPTGACHRFEERIDLHRDVPRAYAELRSLLGSGRYDLVHAHSSHAGALLRAMPRPIPVVYTPHALATLAARWSREWFVGQFEHLLGRRSIVIAAVSDDEAERARRLSPKSAVVRITNRAAVDGGHRSAFASCPRVVGCGRLTRQKDPEFFAEVARLCRLQRLPYAFTWVGAGRRRDEELLAGAGVTVTGWLAEAEVSDALAAHTVYLHSAMYEGAAIGLLNAAASGLPTIGRPVPGVLELPWVRRVRSPAEAVAALRDLSEPAAWSGASQQALIGAQRFDRGLQRARLLDAYAEALRRHGRELWTHLVGVPTSTTSAGSTGDRSPLGPVTSGSARGGRREADGAEVTEVAP